MRKIVSLCLITVIVVLSGLSVVGCASSDESAAATEPAYRCEICDTGFVTEAEYRQHMKTHHPDQVE